MNIFKNKHTQKSKKDNLTKKIVFGHKSYWGHTGPRRVNPTLFFGKPRRVHVAKEK